MHKKIFFFFVLFFLSNIYLYAHTMEFITSEQLKKVQLIYGNEGKKRLLLFDKMLLSAKSKTTIEKLKIVNDFFNNFTYKSDNIHWKEKDYWASPFEFIGSGAGDCEDYAIAKYFALRLLGIESSKLQITFGVLQGKSNKKFASHVVLNYRHKSNASPIILDNINKRLTIAVNRKDLRLYYNFNISKIMKLQSLLWS